VTITSGEMCFQIKLPDAAEPQKVAVPEITGTVTLDPVSRTLTIELLKGVAHLSGLYVPFEIHGPAGHFTPEKANPAIFGEIARSIIAKLPAAKAQQPAAPPPAKP
jgi:hypothetical protein